MRRAGMYCAIAMMVLARGSVALAEDARGTSWTQSLTDKFPWLPDFTAAILAVGIICLLVYWLRPVGAGVADFSIEVDGEDVQFKGRFPREAEATIAEFLVEDCRIQGSYEVVGKWQDGRLAVNVRGENAMMMEQRIRNFLKLNIKPPRR